MAKSSVGCGIWKISKSEIEKIVSQAGMDIVSIAATDGGRIWATYIDDDDGRQYTIEIGTEGITELSIDRKVFYTKN